MKSGEGSFTVGPSGMGMPVLTSSSKRGFFTSCATPEETANPSAYGLDRCVFREDKDIVEHEQRAYDAQGADWNNEVFPAIRDLRGVLGRCGSPVE